MMNSLTSLDFYFEPTTSHRMHTRSQPLLGFRMIRTILTIPTFARCLAFSAGILLSGVSVATEPATVSATDLRQQALQHFAPLPHFKARYEQQQADSHVHNNATLVHMGKVLFKDSLLSLRGKNNCRQCHRVMDDRAVSYNFPAFDVSGNGQPAPYNTPAIKNMALAKRFGWRGEHESLESFIAVHLLDERITAIPSKEAVIRRLDSNPSYDVAFTEAFRDDDPDQKGKVYITYDNTVRALAAYLRTAGSQDPFDAFLNGNDKALSSTQQQGLALFMSAGCASCHSGTLLGTEKVVNLGADGDELRFRVPSLRNVGLTGPYLHDGSVTRLDDAIRHRVEGGKASALSDAEVRLLKSFLYGLTEQGQL
jgi:cytochrome c peroxidase